MAEVEGGEKLEAVMASMGDRITNATEVRVGFFGTSASGESVPTYAALNNFGAPAAGIPARPFFSDMVRDKSPDWGDKFAAVLKACDYDAEKALSLMGVGISDQLRDAIQEFSGAPNSDVTNLLKQRFPKREGMTFADVLQARHDVAKGVTAPAGKQLNWSGDMAQSVSSEVV